MLKLGIQSAMTLTLQSGVRLHPQLEASKETYERRGSRWGNWESASPLTQVTKQALITRV